MSLAVVLKQLERERDATLVELQAAKTQVQRLSHIRAESDALVSAARVRRDRMLAPVIRHTRLTAGQLQSHVAGLEECERRRQLAIVAHDAAISDLEKAQCARVEAEQKLRAVELLVQRRADADELRGEMADERQRMELLVLSQR